MQAPASVPVRRESVADGAPPSNPGTSANVNGPVPRSLLPVAPAIARALLDLVSPWIDDEGPGMGTALDDEDLARLPVRNARDAGLIQERHHWFPRELDREGFYAERGFATDEIDEYTSEFSQGEHQALHGGGDYKLAKEHWPEGSWNEKLRMEHDKMERDLGRRLTREELLEHNLDMRRQFKVEDKPVIPYKAPR